MKKILAVLLSFLFFTSTVFADTTRYEASDDGSLTKSGSSYSLDDYEWEDTKKCIRAEYGSGGIETRAFKRFIMDLGSETITSATLYWYLVEYNDEGTNTNVTLEQIADYGTLVASATDFAAAATHDYGDVMTPATTHPGWVSQDVTDEMEASKADAYVAFRWRLSSQPASGYQEYYLGAYEETSLKAYLVLVTSTGWSHIRDGVANASIAKIDGVAKASIAKVDGK